VRKGALEKEWVRQTLDALGHVYHVQPSLASALGTPDYVFFADEPATGCMGDRGGGLDCRGEGAVICPRELIRPCFLSRNRV